jgi:hypothetical protein
MPGAELNPEPERKPSTTKSLAFLRHPALPSTCRRRALGEPHDSRLLSARSLAISARARRGSVLMHIRLYMRQSWMMSMLPGLSPPPSIHAPRASTVRGGSTSGSQSSFLHGSSVRRQRSCFLWPPERGRASHACNDLSHLVGDRPWPISSK